MTPEELAVSLLRQVMAVSGQVAGRMHEGLDRLGLTEQMANLLWILHPDEEPQSLRKLAAQLHCDPSNITLISAKLEGRGLAERRAHPEDGRVRTLVLTDEGRKVRDRLLSTVTRHSPLAGLDHDEQQVLHVLLAKALATL